MIAVLGGLGAALAWAVAALCSARASRLIGSTATLAWAMLIGLVAISPLLLASGSVSLGRTELAWMGLSGLGNIIGLLAVYRAFQFGKVGIVAPIVSTEGAIAAVVSVAAGEPLSVAAGIVLGVIVAGVAVVAAAGSADVVQDRSGIRHQPIATGYAIGAAISFGLSLYATGQVGATLPAAWAVLPARLIGVLAVAVPLALLSRLRLTRTAAPLVVAVGLAEVTGFMSFTVGATAGIAISAVLASQFAAVAAVAAHFLFGERLSARQAAGAATIAVSVALLTAIQA
ncbi:MAG TPA: EamA family transporter [Actinomycetes bacterium]|nr:EamA family transporter [Actinomycetes bacterium]